MEEQQSAWELVSELPKSPAEDTGKVQARGYINRDLNEWMKAHYKSSGLQLADVYGELLECAIREKQRLEEKSLRTKAIQAFGPEYKTILKSLL